MKISAIMINSRGKIHPDWVETAVQSMKDQFRKVDEIIIIDNLDRKKTVGKCLNEAVQAAEGDYIINCDDDDWWTRDHVMILEQYAMREPDYVAWASRCTLYMDREGHTNRGQYSASMNYIHRGLWRRDYLLKYPYNETLEKGIDRESIADMIKRGDKMFVINHHFGYYTRKHSDYSCTDK